MFAGLLVPPEAIELSWEAPPECPNGGAVREAIEDYAADGESPPTRATGTITRLGEEYTLSLSVAQPGRIDSRTLTSPDCGSLAQAAGLIVAVALDPLAVVRTEQARDVGSASDESPAPVSASPTPRRTPPPPPRPAVRDDRAPARPQRTPIRLALRPEIAGGIGILPEPGGLGFGGAVGVLGRHWRAEVGIQAWLERHEAAEGTGFGADLTLLSGAARGCYVLRQGRLEVPLCGGVEVGRYRGRGTAPGDDLRVQDEVWVGSPISAGVAWSPIGLLALYGRAEAVVGIRRPGFHLDGVADDGSDVVVGRAGAAGARAIFGVEVRLF